VRQVRAATDHAINACGRLAGADLPSFSNTETTIPELKDRIAKTIDFLKGLKPAQIDGSEDKAIKIAFPSGATREFTGQSLLLTNSLPNFYFHCTMPTTSCAIAGSSSASAISWARRSRFDVPDEVQRNPRPAGSGWPERSEGRVRGTKLATRIPRPADGARSCPSPASPLRGSAPSPRFAARDVRDALCEKFGIDNPLVEKS